MENPKAEIGESRVSQVAPTVKNLPAVWEIWVQSLGQEDPLEKGVATHSSILAWGVFQPGESHGQRSLVGYSPWGCKESDTTERLHFTIAFHGLLWWLRQ